MKWKKLGKIFDPTNYRLVSNCFDYAQSPQALVYDDYIRIYFSTRERDSTGKYLSHIAFVDMDKDLAKVLQVSTAPVIGLGGLGCYDEHGIFPLNVLRVQDKILGYIGGWNRRVSVSIDGAIGLAVSRDNGLTFARIGDGPVLASSLNEPFLVGDPFVLLIDDIYHMWYIYGKEWINNPDNDVNERIYKIGHARSTDGIIWTKDNRQLVDDRLNDRECQALPTVIQLGAKYHMIFCYREVFNFRQNRESGYRLGYAVSTDLENWVRDDRRVGIDVSDEGWDSDMQCYPHMFQSDGRIYLLYNGNSFGKSGFGAAILEEE